MNTARQVGRQADRLSREIQPLFTYHLPAYLPVHLPLCRPRTTFPNYGGTREARKAGWVLQQHVRPYENNHKKKSKLPCRLSFSLSSRLDQFGLQVLRKNQKSLKARNTRPRFPPLPMFRFLPSRARACVWNSTAGQSAVLLTQPEPRSTPCPRLCTDRTHLS